VATFGEKCAARIGGSSGRGVYARSQYELWSRVDQPTRETEPTNVVSALALDPIIRAMAAQLVDAGVEPDDLCMGTGWPRLSFQTNAADEYVFRGGRISSHHAGPAEAIVLVMRERQPGAEGRGFCW
jgi:hypothetical protein